MSMVIVRFYVGTKEEDAIVRTYNKLQSNYDRIPPGVSRPIIKVRSIDDVPILSMTLWGKKYDSYQLRQIAGEMEHTVKQTEDVSETHIIGGQPRTVRVVLDTDKLAAYRLTPGAIVNQLQAANVRAQAGGFSQDNREFQVDVGRFLSRAEDLQQIVVGVNAGRPVYLRDVADKLQDGLRSPPTTSCSVRARARDSRLARIIPPSPSLLPSARARTPPTSPNASCIAWTRCAATLCRAT
jgi:multidrug efflux pump subunit AcrB